MYKKDVIEKCKPKNQTTSINYESCQPNSKSETVFLSQQNIGIYELKKGSLQASNRESLSKELSNQYSRSILEMFVVCTATTTAHQFTNKNTIWATISRQ